MTFGMKAGLVGMILALAPMAANAQAADPARGGTLFKQRCGACHSLAADTSPRPGPSLKGVVGRKAAAVANFKYSPAMKGANVTWTAANLDKYLAGPPKMIPGTFMMISVANPKDRADIAAFLATQK